MKRLALGVALLAVIVTILLRDDPRDVITPPQDSSIEDVLAPQLMGGARASQKPSAYVHVHKRDEIEAPAAGPFQFDVRVIGPDRTAVQAATLHFARRESELLFAPGRQWTAAHPRVSLEEGTWWVQGRSRVGVESHPFPVTRDAAGQTLRLFLFEADRPFLYGQIILPKGLALPSNTAVRVAPVPEGAPEPNGMRIAMRSKRARLDASRTRYRFGPLGSKRYLVAVMQGPVVCHREYVVVPDDPLELDLRLSVHEQSSTPVFVHGPDGQLLSSASGVLAPMLRVVSGTGSQEQLEDIELLHRSDGAYLVRVVRHELGSIRTYRLTARRPGFGEVSAAFEPGRPLDLHFVKPVSVSVRVQGVGSASPRQLLVALLPPERVAWEVTHATALGVDVDKDGRARIEAVQPGVYDLVALSDGLAWNLVHLLRQRVEITGDTTIDLTLPTLSEIPVVGVPKGARSLLVRRVEGDVRWAHQKYPVHPRLGVPTLRFLAPGHYEAVVIDEAGAERTWPFDVPATTELRLDER